MANPNVGALTTLNYDRDIKLLTSATTTVVSEVATGNVQVAESILIASAVAGIVTVNLSNGTTPLVSSISVSGFTTEQIPGPIVLKEGDYITGSASANASIYVTVNKRVIT